uniref:Ig-like domain-containing protein n=1 Tax=Sinocyclocheilus anshuiensis TaxID=1608454 RepID=A0A671SRI8_9TELE
HFWITLHSHYLSLCILLNLLLLCTSHIVEFYQWFWLLFLTGSHSLWLLATYIKGQSPFPKFGITYMLDDIIIGYYDSERKLHFVRGNTTEDDDAFDENYHMDTSNDMYKSINYRIKLQRDNHTNSLDVHQILIHCEMLDNMESGHITAKGATGGSTVVELHFLNRKTTFSSSFHTKTVQPFLRLLQYHYENFNYSLCMETLKGYLKKRGNQRKSGKVMKPRVRLIQKANSDSGGFRVSCLATGFYPRHINLTLFRDEQPVSDHEITGGDLLPNADGTYQMRKSLEISAADKHRYTCSATHLSLDNKLDVTLVTYSVLVVCILGLALLTVAAIKWIMRRRWQSGNTRHETVQ